jgi:uncharacterized protein DUF1302
LIAARAAEYGAAAMRMRAVVIVLVALAARADAVYLDVDRDFQFRMRAYNESAFATEESEPQTRPHRAPFQLIEHRNFINPELEGNLTRRLPFHLDDFSFRLALWGFYDGIYEYGTSQYDRARNNIQARLSQGHTNTAPVTRTNQLIDTRKIYTYQGDPVLGGYGEIPFRVNEAYFNVTEGPLFLRIGRQAISWGESDTIGLLDANNPFDVTRAVPGLFEDIDEARIPLWTLRGTYRLFDSWKFLQSGFAEAYLVPGSIDTTVSPTPIPTASPYSPPQDDPQSLIAGLIPPSLNPFVKGALGGVQVALYDHLPTRSMSQSRFGFRLSSVIARDYTTSVWYYRTFANPVPRFLPLDLSRSPLVAGPGAPGPTQVITEIYHGLVDVIGGSTSFFSEPLDGIIRGELEYFLNEPAFVPNVNIPFENLLRTPAVRRLLNSPVFGQNIPAGQIQGHIPYADFLRFELGYDRFFFVPALNPSNSFTWVTAYVGQWNLSETFTGVNYRFDGQQKVTSTGTRIGANAQNLTLATIGKLHTVATDFVDLYPYESFFQSHLETNYLHGRLTPAITMIVGLDGVYALPVGVTYRYSDNMVLDLKYTALGGNFYWPFGFFRDRSQVSARITFLLN